VEKIRWGILGTGRMAGDFAEALRLLPEADLVAVGSRRQETAEAFGQRFGVPHRHTSYEALAADPDVDIVYIATPHIVHHHDALMSLHAGKHILLEKAFTMSAREASEVITLARSRGLFAMEAMWTRFFPAAVRLRELVAQGAVGELHLMRADLSHRVPYDPHHRLWDPQQGGGALLDIGIYPISLAFMILGEPQEMAGVGYIDHSEVDAQSACLLKYANGAIAVLSFSQLTDAPREALICGSKGTLRIHGRWQQPSRLSLIRGKEEQVFDIGYEGTGYHYQAAEVMRCIQAGLQESPIMPLDETLAIMRVMDSLRVAWGLRYPGE